jgi:hypothetical protein
MTVMENSHKYHNGLHLPQRKNENIKHVSCWYASFHALNNTDLNLYMFQ